MVLSRKLNLLIIAKLLVKIACGRESSVRKICDFKWRSQLRDCSIEVILKKIKLIFSLCTLPTLRIIANNVFLMSVTKMILFKFSVTFWGEEAKQGLRVLICSYINTTKLNVSFIFRHDHSIYVIYTRNRAL